VTLAAGVVPCGAGGGGGAPAGGACLGIGGDVGGEVGVGAVTIGVPGTGGGDAMEEGAVGWPPTGFLVTMFA